ncbi:MAG TPA: hypothetical protein VFX45_00565 [Solirubrobacterales bacterium]|nr:hypothetical protein [Solirubrobacterales bacterium]
MRPFRQLVPPGIVLATAGEEGQEAPLLDSEAEAVLSASAERRRSFALGRACARQALGALGIGPCAIPSGPRGEPVWPSGIAGSITHRNGFWAAAVAPSAVYPALGIDAELNRRLPPRVGKRVAEGTLPARQPGIHWEAVAFSAKEASFKARDPQRPGALGLLGIEVVLDPLQQTFQAGASDGDPPGAPGLKGVFSTAGPLILTASWSIRTSSVIPPRVRR